MRFRFQAIDDHGRVVRGVMSADDEQAARDVLVSEHVYPKTLEPVGEDEPITWGPRRRVKETLAAHHREAMGEHPKPVRACFETQAVAGFDAPEITGQAGLDEAGNFVFRSTNPPAHLKAEIANIEEVRTCGFPQRLLRLTMLNGHIYEFTAGMFLTKGVAREVMRTLNKG